jgi:hypothetical protein
MQLINSASEPLNTVDVFAFIRVDSVKTVVIRSESCFKTRTEQYVTLSGIQASLVYLLTLLKVKLKKQEINTTQDSKNKESVLTDEFVGKHPIIISLNKSCQYNKLNGFSEIKNGFIIMRIGNLVSNLNRLSDNHRYAGTIRKFSMCLFILEERQAYAFICLNLPGSVPTVDGTNAPRPFFLCAYGIDIA